MWFRLSFWHRSFLRATSRCLIILLIFAYSVALTANSGEATYSDDYLITAASPQNSVPSNRTVSSASTQLSTAPVIQVVTPGYRSLGVGWNLPTGVIDRDVASYDLRYIQSDASDKADANWEVKSFLPIRTQAILKGLTDGVQYDVQVRVVTQAASAWSSTVSGTPRQPGGKPDSAIELTNDVGVIGNLTSSQDRDYYSFTLTERSDVKIFASGELDADGEFTGSRSMPRASLYLGTPDSDSEPIDSASPPVFWNAPELLQRGSGFGLARLLEPGTYYLSVHTGTFGNNGTYQLNYRVMKDGDSIEDAPEIKLNQFYGGVIQNYTTDQHGKKTYHTNSELIAGDYDHKGLENDYFKFTLDQATDVHIYTTSKLDMNYLNPEWFPPGFNKELELQDSQGRAIAYNYDALAHAHDNRLTDRPKTLDFISPYADLHHPSIVKHLPAGTYFLQVDGAPAPSFSSGRYKIRVDDINASVTDFDSAIPLMEDELAVSVLNQSVEANYFTFDSHTQAFVRLDAMSSNETLPDLSLQVFDANRQLISDVSEAITHEDYLYASMLPKDEIYDRGVILPRQKADYADLLFSYQGWLEGRDTDNRFYVKVTSDGETGPYAIRLSFDQSQEKIRSSCRGLDRRANAPTDPYYGCQWYLNNTGQIGGPVLQDINVESVWAEGIKGSDVNVLIVDKGFNDTHPDLRDSVTVANNFNKVTQTTRSFNPVDDHGTMVAGIIAAAHNGIGGRGIAPDAKIYGYNLLDTPGSFGDPANAFLHKLDLTAVSNNSWASETAGLLDGRDYSQQLNALRRGVEEGFDGKGIAYIFGIGNDYLNSESNLNVMANYYASIGVCAIDYRDVRHLYSLIGANLWICSPSGGAQGSLPDGLLSTTGAKSYRFMEGTSASTAVVSGVVALLRSAYPELTWRDVKLILAGSARMNDPDASCTLASELNDSQQVDANISGWLTGALRYGSDSQRYRFSHCYGFGAVDAKSALDLAKGWESLPEFKERPVPEVMVEASIPDGASIGSYVESSSNVGVDIGFIEFVQVDVDFKHANTRDLEIKLVAPSGTESRLLSSNFSQRASRVSSGDGRTSPSFAGSYRFGSARHLGEDPNGQWTLKVRDAATGATGTLKSWSITIYGHGEPRLTPKPTVTVKPTSSVQPPPPDRSVPPPPPDRSVQPPFSGVGGGPAPVDNESPVFREGSTALRTVAENSPAGTPVGEPVAADDLEGDAVIYRLGASDSDSETFTINSRTGQISVAANANLDYETEPISYSVVVTATDPDGSAEISNITVTINVTDQSTSTTIDDQDKNNNERIDPAEMFEALRLYKQQKITHEELIEIIRHYLSS